MGSDTVCDAAAWKIRLMVRLVPSTVKHRFRRGKEDHDENPRFNSVVGCGVVLPGWVELDLAGIFCSVTQWAQRVIGFTSRYG
jgi:hypothetical protein